MNKKKQEINKALSKEMKTIIISVVAILIGVIGITYFTQKKSEVAVTEPTNLIREFNHRTGPDNAKVKIVEFYDPECEACSAFFPYVKDILAQYKNDIQLITRYALYHGNSTTAAKASEAAARQNKFWEYQEALFVNQHEWSHRQDVPMAAFEQYAKNLGLDMDKFRLDMNDMSIMTNISIDISDGKTLGVNGTPTIFINGKKLEKLHPTNFKEMVELELKK